MHVSTLPSGKINGTLACHAVTSLVLLMKLCNFFLVHFLVEEKKEKTVKVIKDAKQKVKMEITVLKNRLKLAKETISQFKDEIAKLQENQYVMQ